MKRRNLLFALTFSVTLVTIAIARLTINQETAATDDTSAKEAGKTLVMATYLDYPHYLIN